MIVSVDDAYFMQWKLRWILTKKGWLLANADGPYKMLCGQLLPKVEKILKKLNVSWIWQSPSNPTQ